MRTFMVVARFKPEVTMDDIRALIPAEQAQAKKLEEAGQLGTIRVAMPQRTVFLETFGADEAAVHATIESLPLAALWDLDFYETTPPAGTAL